MNIEAKDLLRNVIIGKATSTRFGELQVLSKVGEPKVIEILHRTEMTYQGGMIYEYGYGSKIDPWQLIIQDVEEIFYKNCLYSLVLPSNIRVIDSYSASVELPEYIQDDWRNMIREFNAELDRMWS